jgi:hypothetical protein
MQEIDRLKTIKFDNPRLKFGIDRDEENKDVKDYILTGDQNIFNRIYQRRKPTIEYLANKYNWLNEDAASEIRIVLVRTVNSYGVNGKKTDFNTFFYSSVKNHFSNMAKRRYRKKRTTIDGLDPLNRMVQLDSCISDDETSFHELISQDDDTVRENINFQALLFEISQGNKYIISILTEIHDMTKREITKNSNLIFSFSFPLISGDMLSDISDAISLPSDVYDVVHMSTKDSIISAKICVDGKKFTEHIANVILDKNIITTKNKGI